MGTRRSALSRRSARPVRAPARARPRRPQSPGGQERGFAPPRDTPVRRLRIQRTPRPLPSAPAVPRGGAAFGARSSATRRWRYATASRPAELQDVLPGTTVALVLEDCRSPQTATNLLRLNESVIYVQWRAATPDRCPRGISEIPWERVRCGRT